MILEELLTPLVIVPLLAGALIAWIITHYYSVPSLNTKLRQAKRHKKASFGNVTTHTKPDKPTEPVDSPFGTYVINGNGTVSDLQNELMWVQAPWGMVWDGEKFMGEPIRVNWWDATELFGKGVVLGYSIGKLRDEHLEKSKYENGYTKGKCITSFAGNHDWRLPTAFEINTISFSDPSQKIEGYEYSRASAANSLREKIFPNLGVLTNNYWLWCAHEQGAGMAWAVDGNWAPGDFKAKSRYFIILVRNL